jgi:hypothetical protein
LLNDKDTEIHNEYESMTVEELEQQLREAFFYTDQIDEPLMEDLEQICVALDKKKPLEDLDTVEEYWKRFTKYYAGDMLSIGIQNDTKQTEAPTTWQHREPKVKTRDYHKALRVALIAAVIIALLAGATCVAAAFGYNLWGWIPVWDADELHFVSETQEPVLASTISTALKQLGIDEPLYPTWLPEGFVLTEAKIETEPVFMSEYYLRVDDEESLSITISADDAFGTAYYQKVDSPPVEYIVGETMHYIIDNTNNVAAIWFTADYSVLIVGTIGIEEMRMIIDSIYY